MTRLFCITLALCAFTVSAQQTLTQPRIGQPVQRPDAPTIDQTYGFLVDFPSARIVEPGTIRIEFETAEPTPPARVYYGINTLDEELPYPRFRDSANEPGNFDDLSTTHTVEFSFRRLLTRIPVTPYEPRIVYRLAVTLPSKGERYFDGRVYFDPETLADTVNIDFGPIVDQVTSTSAIISWRTDRPATGTVHLANRSLSDQTETTWHQLPVKGLQPGHAYEYSVQSGATRTRGFTFQTDDPGAPFRFATMVDSRESVGPGERRFSGVAGRALALLGSHAYYNDIDFILFAGDLINGYTTSVRDFQLQLEAFQRAMEPVHNRLPIYEGMGNHEALIDIWRIDGNKVHIDKAGDDSAEAVFADTFVNPANGPADEGPQTPPYAENVYWFDHGNARFFVLNNNYWWVSNPHIYGGNLEGYILPNQIDWLREQVALADADPKIQHLFYAAQEPPFPNGGHTADSMWYLGGDTNRDGEINEADIDIVEKRNTLWEIISASPKSVAFITGDEHAYSRILITGETPVGHRRTQDGREAAFVHPVWQVTSGGAGAPWYDRELHMPWAGELAKHATQPHYALFSVDGPRVTLDVYAQTGQLIDQAVLRERD